MNSKCIECGKSFSYEKIKPVMGTNLNDLRPTVCSDRCEILFIEKRQREVSKNVFRRIISVMPEAYKKVRMTDFEEMNLTSFFNNNNHVGAESIIKKFCNSKYWNISLFSPEFGNGKTRLGLYILACLALKGIYKTKEVISIQDAGYYSAIDIIKILKTETYDAKQYNLNKFYHSRVLMIDDLGQENEYSSIEIAGILKVREENNKKTIITSNLNNVDFEKRYTNRVYSRICKGSFLVKGEDKRLIK